MMLFVLNQFIAVSHSFREISKISVKSLLPTRIVLSSPKFASSASLMKKNKSFIKRLKRIGPKIDPCKGLTKAVLASSENLLLLCLYL